MKKLLLYNHGGCGNRGCEAIVRSTSRLFASAGAECRVTSMQAEYDKAVGLPDVKEIIADEIAPLSAARLVNSVLFRLGQPREAEVARKHSPVIRAGKKSDVCLSVGGDTYCYNWMEWLSVINGRLYAAGRPLVLWGCSVEPSLLEEGPTLSELQKYSLIVARESISEKAMQDKGLPVRRWCDPAFFLEKEELPLPEGWREGATAGINLSPLVLSKTPDKAKALDAFETLIRHILAHGQNVALIPHVTWEKDNDMDALRELKARFADEKRVLLLPDTLNAVQLKGYIARLTTLVTARTHASIAAYSTAVPTLVIGYSVKARGIARDLFGDEAGHLIPAQELTDGAQLTKAWDALMQRAEAERTFLEKRLPEYTAGGEDIVKEILSLGGKP